MIAAVQQRFLATACACRLSDSYRATLAVCVGLQAAAAILIVRRAPRQPFV
jgi:hypothetical protein